MSKPTWCIHLVGPDDILPAASRAHAIKKAHAMNADLQRQLSFDEDGIYPSIWAVPSSYEALGIKPTCSGECLSGNDIGIPSGAIAYPHPDCPIHGGDWIPQDNEWSRKYVAANPERFLQVDEGTPGGGPL